MTSFALPISFYDIGMPLDTYGLLQLCLWLEVPVSGSSGTSEPDVVSISAIKRDW